MTATSHHLKLPKGTQIPNHIAIVLDGNRRWARARGLSAWDGHKAGYFALRSTIEASRKLGVHTLTVWGFSTENWDRPGPEIQKIMRLIGKAITDTADEAMEHGVRFIHLGRKDRLPKELLTLITEVEKRTEKNKKHILNLALDYGGRDEILRATRKIIEDGIPASKVDEKLFSSYLDTSTQPYPFPDLFIRTSGEQRTSGLLPWQLTYAEFYWERDHLPDMTPEKLKNAILDYSRRRRRFGGNDVLEHLSFKPELTAKFELAWWRLSKIPEGTRFSEYAAAHLKEQFGLSAHLASEASKYILQSVKEGNSQKWVKATKSMLKFYKLIKEEIKLAFEPAIVASIDVKLMQKVSEPQTEFTQAEIEDLSRSLVAEVYRISDFQAAKAAHLRALATAERRAAMEPGGEEHWEYAKDYLEKYYHALKDRVA